jgi:hypothetical protein
MSKCTEKLFLLLLDFRLKTAAFVWCILIPNSSTFTCQEYGIDAVRRFR